MLKLLHAMREADGEFLGQELRGAKQSACKTQFPRQLICPASHCAIKGETRAQRNELRTRRWAFTELHHLLQAHAGGREGRVVLDGVHQHVRLLPRHGGGSNDDNDDASAVVGAKTAVGGGVNGGGGTRVLHGSEPALSAPHV